MEPVQLLVYDLSQGMARMMSMPLTGRQINGIWHTSIVVYGKEYCFGQGIQVFNPQQTPYGVPVERISMGTTQIPKLVFLEYIETLKTIWTADKYHLLDNNCNSFTDEVCQFLVGSGIPKHITGLPTEFLNTPFGQQIRPMIENMFGTSRHSPAVSMNNISDIPKQVISCTNLSRLLEIIRSNRCVAIDFTSKMCGPCRIISPEFEKILEVVNAKSEKVVGIAVEIDVARDIANHYEINSTPTFMFFLDGKKFSEFRGANVAELKSSIEFLIYTANPPHPNSRLNLQNLVRLSKSSCVHFTLSSDLDKIFAKLEESVAKQGLQADLVGLKKWVLEHDLKKTESLPRQWMDVKRLLGSLTPVSLFPLLDILRLIVQNPIAARYFVYEDTDMIFIKICNLFDLEDPHFNFRMVSAQILHDECPRDAITLLIIDTLLAPEYQLRQASALLAFNMAWTCTQIRSFIELECTEYDEHWTCEITAALCTAIENESLSDKKNDETAFRLVSAAGLLLAFSSAPTVELAQLVGLESYLQTISAVKRTQHAELTPKICKEIKSILLQT